MDGNPILGGIESQKPDKGQPVWLQQTYINGNDRPRKASLQPFLALDSRLLYDGDTRKRLVLLGPSLHGGKGRGGFAGFFHLPVSCFHFFDTAAKILGQSFFQA